MRRNEGNIQNALAAGLLGIIAVMVLMLFYRETPPTNKELVSLALGVLLGSMKDVYNYYFGTTRSSDRKDEIVHTALATQAALPPGDTIVVPPPATLEVKAAKEPGKVP